MLPHKRALEVLLMLLLPLTLKFKFNAEHYFPLIPKPYPPLPYPAISIYLDDSLRIICDWGKQMKR